MHAHREAAKAGRKHQAVSAKKLLDATQAQEALAEQLAAQEREVWLTREREELQERLAADVAAAMVAARARGAAEVAAARHGQEKAAAAARARAAAGRRREREGAAVARAQREAADERVAESGFAAEWTALRARLARMAAAMEAEATATAAAGRLLLAPRGRLRTAGAVQIAPHGARGTATAASPTMGAKMRRRGSVLGVFCGPPHDVAGKVQPASGDEAAEEERALPLRRWDLSELLAVEVTHAHCRARQGEALRHWMRRATARRLTMCMSIWRRGAARIAATEAREAVARRLQHRRVRANVRHVFAHLRSEAVRRQMRCAALVTTLRRGRRRTLLLALALWARHASTAGAAGQAGAAAQATCMLVNARRRGAVAVMRALLELRAIREKGAVLALWRGGVAKRAVAEAVLQHAIAAARRRCLRCALHAWQFTGFAAFGGWMRGGDVRLPELLHGALCRSLRALTALLRRQKTQPAFRTWVRVATDVRTHSAVLAAALTRGTSGAKRACLARWGRRTAAISAARGSAAAVAAARDQVAVAIAQRDVAARDASAAITRADGISTSRQQLVLKLEERRQAIENMRSNLQEQQRTWRAQMAQLVTENNALKVRVRQRARMNAWTAC